VAAAEAARATADAITTTNPKIRYSIGRNAAVLACLAPGRLLDRQHQALLREDSIMTRHARPVRQGGYDGFQPWD
jgi:hypothetical protein